MPDPFPKGPSFEFNGAVFAGMREARRPQGPVDKAWRKWKQEEEGSAPGHCVGELPLYLFQSPVRLGLPCSGGPAARWGRWWRQPL